MYTLSNRREGGAISLYVLLQVSRYLIYAVIVAIAAYLVYRALSTQEEREQRRTKLQKQIQKQQAKLLHRSKETKIERLLRKAGYPLGLNSIRFRILSITLLLGMVVGYGVLPIVNNTMNIINVYILVGAAFFTLTSFKFSPIVLFLNYLIGVKQRKQRVELFTLFDMLKAEMNSLSEGQQVNIYGIIKDSTGMFEHIDDTINRFLSLWKTNPEQAKDSFVEMIPGTSSESLAEVLYRLDKTTKKEALQIVENESQIFSSQFLESQFQNNNKRKTFYFSFYSFSLVMVLIWLLVLVSTMASSSINNNSVF